MAAETGHEVVLVGRQEVVEPELVAAGAYLELVHAPEVVEMHDDPAKAVRDKPGSSVLTAARLVAARQADALVSAGSTGAAMAAASIVIGRLKGVLPPGHSHPHSRSRQTGPAARRRGHLEVRPVHMVQFGVMGRTPGRDRLRDRPSPSRPAQTSAGSPRRDVIWSVPLFRLLEEAPVNFVGNLEGGDITPRCGRCVRDRRLHRQRGPQEHRRRCRAGGPADRPGFPPSAG